MLEADGLRKMLTKTLGEGGGGLRADPRAERSGWTGDMERSKAWKNNASVSSSQNLG